MRIWQIKRMKTLMISCFFLLCWFPFKSASSISQRYESFYNVGDSLSDTGNTLAEGAQGFPVIKYLPFGETFFHHPTGRCSDGRIIVDFIGEALRLPFLPPYLGLGNDSKYIRKGVNFAVAGATALDPQFFYALNLGSILSTNHSLSVQISWFKKLKPFLCSTKQECSCYFGKSLFLVGEIGGNDYTYLFNAGRSINEVQPLVPLVVSAIINATAMLIEEGVVNLVVPGNLPFGCCPVYLTMYASPNQSDYDPQTGCLKGFNDFSQYHNYELKKSLQILRKKYPYARISYGDYYGAAIRFYRAPKRYGFYGSVLKACCGGGGPYNFNISAACGLPGSSVCKDPSSFANWDGIHWTEAAYRVIAKGLIHGPFTYPPHYSFVKKYKIR